MSPRGRGPKPAGDRSDPPRGTLLPLRHPAYLAAILACALSLVLSASYRLYDTDLWTLLVTGKAIWKSGTIPRTDQWAWPTFGEPQVMSSWLFRWRLWPLWERGGVAGLFAWRWLVTLATFAVAWLAARRMGARGVLALPLLAWCGLVYRLRTDLRPELVAGFLFALSLWILERARSSPRPSRWDARLWLVPIASVWINSHVSWHLLFVLWGLYLLDGRGGRPWLLVAAALAATLVNPWGWHAPWQAIQFGLFWRDEPIFRTIAELQPLDWSAHLRDGLPLLLAAWAAAAAWRARRRGVDRVEALGGLLFTLAAIRSQRFLGTAVLFAAPFFARDAGEWVASRRWRLEPAAKRGALAAAAALVIGVAEWMRPDLPLGVGLNLARVPVAACDFVAAHGVRGRAINDLHFGGYLAWRFWPERERLPFITTQPENARPQDRALYAAAVVTPEGWEALDRRHRFDWAILDRDPSPGEQLLASIANDSRFVPVFMDDVALVFVRRDGPLAAVADSFGYRVVPAERAAREALIGACARDSLLRLRARAEFERQSASSPQNALSEQALGVLALMDGRIEEGRAHLRRALALWPTLESARRILNASEGSGPP